VRRNNILLSRYNGELSASAIWSYIALSSVVAMSTILTDVDRNIFDGRSR